VNFIQRFLAWAPSSTMFINLQLHATLVYCLLFTAGVLWPDARVAAALAAVALAAAKEFWFDATYEVPPQQFGTLTGGGAIQDFAGYLIGIGAAVVLWLVL
jgi:hypothetical protein